MLSDKIGAPSRPIFQVFAKASGVAGQMAIRWADFPHREIGVKIYAKLGTNAVGRSSEDASRHILRRRLRLLAPEDHRRFIELEARDVVELLRCTRDVYREFAEENQCAPLVEAYWVILRFAILPTAIAVIQQKVVDYVKMTRVAGVDLSLLFGVQTHACSNRKLDGSGGKCDPKDRTPASDTELQTLSEYVNEKTLFWLAEDGVWFPTGEGPFAVDDASSIRWSWGLFALKAGKTLTDWLPVRESLWQSRAPWTEGLTTLFRCAQDELLSQWRALPPDSQARELSWKQRPSEFEKIVVPTPENRFEKEGETWAIEFAGETCRLPASLIGLDYISVLLRYAGTSIGAQQLRAQGAAAVPVNPGRLSDLATDPDAGLQTEWTPHAVLDAKTITNYQNAINDLNDRITYAQDTENTREVETLEREKDNVLRELSKQKGLPGRPREFPNQKESARSTVTHAIKLAFKKIEKIAPTTAKHLRNNIATGTFLTYRDCSVRWKT